MTNPESTAERKRRDQHQSEIELFVADRAETIQSDVLNEHNKKAVARGRRSLANLRRAASTAPGADPAIWELTMAGVPGFKPGDAPTPEERATHIALTTFAFHQQSRNMRMHQPRFGLGRSVARLDNINSQLSGGASSEISPVRRRFNAMVTSESLAEVTRHLRGIVGQLRSKDIPLDYGMLAKDLLDFQRGRVDDVRRRWARQYYHLDSAGQKEDNETISDNHNQADRPKE